MLFVAQTNSFNLIDSENDTGLNQYNINANDIRD